MPPTPSPHTHQQPRGFNSTTTLIQLSVTPLLSLNRRKKTPLLRRALFSSRKMIRQILIVLGLGTILLTGLFIYNTAASLNRRLATSVGILSQNGDDSKETPVVLNWQQVEQLVDNFVCAQFLPFPTLISEPGKPAKPVPVNNVEKNCHAPLEPFDSAAFAHRPSGTDLLPFSRILLLILFNHPHAETIPFVEMLYRPLFPNIVYCLPERANDPLKVSKARGKHSGDLPVFDHISYELPLFRILNSTFFMDVDIVTYPQPFMNRMAGENNYACFVEVSRRLLLAPTQSNAKRDRLRAADFDGILVAADDLLVHVWNLASPGYDLTKPWVMDRPIRVYDVQTEKECAVDEPPQDLISSPQFEQVVASRCELDVDWQWFRLYAVEMGEFSNEMEKFALESRLFGDCHHRLRETLGGASRRFLGNGGAGDFYYIPSSLFLQAHDIMSLMAAHNVFVEIAVPTALRCLVANASAGIIHVQGEGMNWAYARSRDRPWSAYSAASSLLLPYYHPLKVAELLLSQPAQLQTQTSPSAAHRVQDLGCFVCKTILPKFRWFREYVARNNTPPLQKPPWL